MAERSVLRLLQFRPVDPGATVDTILRASVLPDLRHQPGLSALLCGRQQGADSADARVVVSVWESAGAMTAALGDGPGELDPWLLADATDARVEVVPVRVAIRSTSESEPSVLRVLRGELRDDDVDGYTGELTTAVTEDVDAGRGPLALFVAVAEPRRCLAVSAWTGWAAIDEATGGRPMDPVRGSFSDRLARRTIDHYEFVPNTEHVAALVPE